MSSRLSLALTDGGLSLPDGPCVVFHPPAQADLTALSKDRLTLVQPRYPEHAHWRERGYTCVADVRGDYASAIVFLPRAKAQARALIADAARVAGLVIVDGAKTDGVDSLLKDIRKRVSVEGTLSKAHGKLFWFKAAGQFDDWRAQARTVDGFMTLPGVFSADGVDPASALLAQVLPDALGPRVVDLGAGWGYLSSAILTRTGVDTLHVVEADHVALTCARTNLPDPRARFHWADATTWTPPEPIDTVVMNPPFHSGRKGDTALGQAFIAAAARMLTPKGTLWMVANRHLPYETMLRSAFREGDELAGNTRFKLFRAARPTRVSRSDGVA